MIVQENVVDRVHYVETHLQNETNIKSVSILKLN